MIRSKQQGRSKQIIEIPFTLPNIKIERCYEKDRQVWVEAHSLAQEGRCPTCEQVSQRRHSWYQRIVQDVPGYGRQLQLKLKVQRFRCQNRACGRQTFVEMLPTIVPFYGRRTPRLSETIRAVGFEAGAEAGARLLRHLSIFTSGDTLLRVMRTTTLRIPATPRVLGVDDWAYRKGKRYGTILVDLERHEVVDLLPNAEPVTLSAWLQVHPGIEIISRDRSGAYAEGSRQGAPHAQQVADRWHLLRNLWETLVISFNPYLAQLRQISLDRRLTTLPSTAESAVVTPLLKPARLLSPAQQARAEQRQYWETIFAQVHQYLAAGVSKRAIVKKMGISRSTVRKYARLSELPLKTSPKSAPRLIDPYWDYLYQRLPQGPISLEALWHELQALGYSGGKTGVQAAMVQVRQALHLPSPRGTPKCPVSPPLRLTPTRLATWVLLPHLSEQQQTCLMQAMHLDSQLELIIGLARDFTWFLRARQPQHFLPWCEAVRLTSLRPLCRFVQSLLQDFEAVSAACSLPWSNGQVEGQINRLKFLKRQMYGRAKFDLLRLRVLYSALHPLPL